MFEYRVKQITEAQMNILEDEEIYPIEENFKDWSGFIIYGDSDLNTRLSEIGLDCEQIDVNETGWEEKWKEFLKPGVLAGDLYYVFDDEPHPYKKTVKILPALAFGTGTHPTTRAAAALLIPICKDKNVIDVGCGSGILAIAAEVVGANRILAMDIDPVALGNTKLNIEWNNCSKTDAWAGGIDSVSPSFKADVVCANIITSVLMAIREDVLNRGAEYIVLSGIMKNEYETFMKQFMTDGYRIEEKVEIEEWCGVRLKKV